MSLLQDLVYVRVRSLALQHCIVLVGELRDIVVKLSNVVVYAALWYTFSLGVIDVAVVPFISTP